MKKDSISIVIAIKDWEPARLDLAIRSHIESTIGKDVEIVVSDFGSKDPAPNKQICDKHGAVYVHTEADIWSRSRALNIGLSIASSDVLLTTDADIIFAPATLESTLEVIVGNTNAVVLAQCSNLSEEFTLEMAQGFPWETIYDYATLRPRWGMGGLCAFSRKTFEAVRGFDERMMVWGAEDNDFVKRCRQSGKYLHWLTGKDVGIYHVWHPPFLQGERDAESQLCFENNKKILAEDQTTVRNYAGKSFCDTRDPLVSINVATFNRAHFLADMIDSVLAQTVQDFELLIYDDGSTDNTREVVESFLDSRIRYFSDGNNNGVAYARNRLIDESRGQYVCVHDDDDIMLPNRLELQLDAVGDGYVGSYGGWIDFNPETAELTHQTGKAPFGVPAVCFVGATLLHPTLMIKTDVMKRLGYETRFRGGSDYNLTFRLAYSGYKMNHCKDFLILRRVHGASLTGQSHDKQKFAALVTVSPFLNNVSNHVENQLRKESKSVLAVNILPSYCDRELYDFLPRDMFDELVEVFDSVVSPGSTTVDYFGSDFEFKKFAVQEPGRPEVPRLPGATSDGRIRTPKLDFDDEEKLFQDLTSLSESIGDSVDNPVRGKVTIVPCNPDDTDLTNIKEAVRMHTHLFCSVAVLNSAGRAFIAVNAESAAMSKMVALNLRAMLRPSRTNLPLDRVQERVVDLEVC